MKRGRIEVGSVGPYQRMNLVIQTHSGKERRILERAIEVAEKHGREVDDLAGAVIEIHSKAVRPDLGKVRHPADSMWHQLSSTKRLDGQRRLAPLQQLPVRRQLDLMEFRPGLDEAPLPVPQRSTQ